MLIIPAIDIRSSRVVRLTQGDFTKETFYSGNPAEVAKEWQDKGAKRLHLVDLDGALAGEPKNLEAIEGICNAIDIPVELGGGLRTDDSVDAALSKGVTNVIIGTRAFTDQDFVKRLVDKFKDKIIVGIDFAGDKIMVEGWISPAGEKPIDFAKKIESLGVKTIIYTNVLKDGTLEKPQLDPVIEVLDAVNIDIIISGGISSIDDIRDLKGLNRKNLLGIITGKALYEDKLDLEEALRVAEE